MELAKFDVFCENFEKNNPHQRPVVNPQFGQRFKKIADTDGLELDYSLTDIRGGIDDLEDVLDDVEFDLSPATALINKENALPVKIQKLGNGVFKKKKVVTKPRVKAEPCNILKKQPDSARLSRFPASGKAPSESMTTRLDTQRSDSDTRK